MKNILITLPMEERHRAYLRSQAGDALRLIFREDTGDLTDMQGAFGYLPPDLAARASGLEWLQIPSAGADSYASVLPERIVLTCASGAYGLAVSEHLVAQTFALVRRLPQYARSQVRHLWEPRGEIISVEGSTVLVLGLGDIGGSYAGKMKALGARVIGVRRTEREKPEYVDEQYTFEALDEVLGRADIVAVVLPGGRETAKLLDARRMRLMKRGAFLLNCGRGTVVDLSGLAEVLAEGHLGGAALDVTDPEPLPEDSPLWDDERVLITPHAAGGFFLPETFERVIRIFGENLRRFANGEELLNVVNRKTGY